MAPNRLRVGFTIGGLRIESLRRSGSFMHVAFTDGSRTEYHKHDDVPAVPLVTLDAGPVPARPMSLVRKVRAHHGVWAGENDGRRGERFIAECSGFDQRF